MATSIASEVREHNVLLQPARLVGLECKAAIVFEQAPVQRAHEAVGPKGLGDRMPRELRLGGALVQRLARAQEGRQRLRRPSSHATLSKGRQTPRLAAAAARHVPDQGRALVTEAEPPGRQRFGRQTWAGKQGERARRSASL